MPAASTINPITAPRLTIVDSAYRGQPLLAAVGVLMLLMMIPTALAMGLDTRTLNGISGWIKPLKFQISLAVQLLTVAWLMLYMPAERRETWLVRGLALVMACAALFEIGYITLQASRGEASHFNSSTPIAQFMYALRGLGAVLLVTTASWIGVLILRHGMTSNPLVFAAGLGLVLGSVIGGVTGV